MRFSFVTLVFLASVALHASAADGAVPIWKEREWDAAICSRPGPNDKRIAACTHIINWYRREGIAMNANSEAARSALGAALLNRGMVYFRMRDLERSLADFEFAIQLRPNNTIGYVRRSWIRREKRQFAEAIADLGKAQSLNPRDAEILNERCWARAMWGQELEAALQDCAQALALEPKDGPAGILDSRGLVYIRLGRFAAAIADYDAALKARPGFAWSLFGRGIARLHSGDQSGGNADIASAGSADPKVAEEYARYGITP